MAQVKDSKMILLGVVVDVEEYPDYNDAGQRIGIGGHKIVVNSGDGMSVVKFPLTETTPRPSLGDRIMWWVRPASWKGDSGGSGMSVRFLGQIAPADFADVLEAA